MFRLLAIAFLLFAQTLSVSARDISHVMGTTAVPDAPQRIVVLTNEGTEAVLALGLTPVGAVRSWYGDPWYPHLDQSMRGVTELGTELAVDLEMVAAMEPDLIIGSKKRHEEIYPQLSAIAPTVFSLDNRDWQANLRLYGQAIGRTDAAEDVLNGYGARTNTLRTALGEAAEETVSVVRFVPGQIYVYQQDSFSGVVLADVGFNRPPEQAQDGLAQAVGREFIPEMQADRLFYLTYDTGNGEGETLEATTLADPLWRALPVVAEGKATQVDDGVWATAGGIFAAHAMLSDIARIYDIEFPEND